MPAIAVAAAIAALYLILDPPSADLAAQTYRVGLFDREGFALWDNSWYGGHHLPGYSVVFPPLASLLGLHVVAALSLVGATAAFTRLARRWVAAGSAGLAGCWFVAGMAGTIVSGRLAFALGAAVGTTAVLAVARSSPRWAAALGSVTALASPVAALFAALIGLAVVARAWAPGSRITSREPPGVSEEPHERVAAAALAAAAALTTGALVLAFPEGGSEPFVASAFWPALLAAAIAVALGGGAVRAGGLLYAVLLIVAFAVPTPIGGNAARLGSLLAGPLAAGLLWQQRRVLVLVLSVPLAYWVLYPPIRDWSQAAGDPARATAYYEPLLAHLRGQPVGRLEIPFTQGHWESARVAPAIPLARGWERQLDRGRNALFYAGTLTVESYRAWLEDNAVRWVALPDAPLDPSARAEAALVRGGLPYLREVWRSEHWRLFEMRRPTPLGATTVGTDSFTTTGGLVRLHWTSYWAVTEGHGCVQRGAGDWTEVLPDPAGSSVRVGIRATPDRALLRGRRCR